MQIKEKIIAFEKRVQDNLDNVYCPVHLCLGAEEVPAALHGCLKPEDWLFSYHRGHGHYLAKGGSEEKLWDEIMGLDTGINAGFSGSQAFSDPSINFHCSAIVGGLIGVATGTAKALKMDGSSAIVVCCFGDAGSEQGVFWESINFAVLHGLPITYICENNSMSVDAHISERQARGIKQRAEAFGLVPASDVQAAVYLARSGYPSIYEAKIERKCAHINMKTMREM